MAGAEATLATQIWPSAYLLGPPTSSSCCYLHHRPPTGSQHPPTSALPLARDARRHGSPTQELRPCRSSQGRHGEEKELAGRCEQPLGENPTKRWPLHRLFGAPAPAPPRPLALRPHSRCILVMHFCLPVGIDDS
jgi:hypothetical protein